jgi:hypothetical protein
VPEAQHLSASQQLPWFITGPGESDILYIITTIVVIAIVVGLGLLFFRLHSLPERLGHKKLQFEIVAVLALLSLFTHNHVFWVAGLLLALIDLPDFTTPLKRMAGALEKISGTEAPADEEAEDKTSRLPTVQQSEQVKPLNEEGALREAKTSRQRLIDSVKRALEMRRASEAKDIHRHPSPAGNASTGKTGKAHVPSRAPDNPAKAGTINQHAKNKGA